MAFERMGLGAILSFETAGAVANMTRAQGTFARLSASAVRLRTSISTIGAGFSALTMAALPLGLAIGYGAKQAINFEQHIADVAAIVRASKADMKLLSDEAIRLGIETKFSASDAASAMELLGRAGFNTQQVLKAVPGTMAMAAAEGMDMASAASIMTTVVRGMGVPLSETAHVTDVLAEASARTNTNIAMLGEGFSYAAPAAHDLGMSLEETTAAMGLLANVGMQGSRSGTMLEAMLRGLKGVTDRSAEALKTLGVNTRDADGYLKPLVELLPEMNAALGQFSREEQDRLLFRIMRTEGSRAFRALQSQGVEAFKTIQEQLTNSSDQMDEFGNRTGAAARMAATRLDTFSGTVTLLKSSLEGFSIVLWGGFLKPAAKSLLDFVNQFNKLIYSVKRLGEGEEVGKLRKEFGENIVDMAIGIRQGIGIIKGAWDGAKASLRGMAEWFGATFGTTNATQVAKWVTVVVGLTAAMGPLGLMLKVVSLVGGGLFSILSGSVGIVSALGSALVALAPILAVIGAAFLVVRNDGESVGDTMRRVADAVMVFVGNVAAFATAVFGPTVQAISGVFEQNILPVLLQLRELIRTIYTDIAAGLEAITIGMLPQWESVGQSIATVFTALGTAFQSVIGGLLNVLTAVWGFLTNMFSKMQAGFSSLLSIIGIVFNFVGFVVNWIGTVVSGVADGITWLVNEFSWLGDVVATIFNTVMSVLEPVLDVLTAIGEVILDVIWVGLQALWAILQPIFSLISWIGQQVWNFLKPGFEAIGVIAGLLRDAFGWLYDNIIRPMSDLVGGALLAAFQAIGGAITAIIEGLKTVWGFVTDILGGISSGLAGVLEQQRRIQKGQSMVNEALRPRNVAEPGTVQMMTLPSTIAAEGARRAEQTTPPRPEDQAPVNVNATIENTTTAQIDGRCVSRSVSRHTAEMRDRSGTEETPWQRRAAVVRNNNFATEPARA